jgi:phosphoenolpyruvate carboxylase
MSLAMSAIREENPALSPAPASSSSHPAGLVTAIRTAVEEATLRYNWLKPESWKHYDALLVLAAKHEIAHHEQNPSESNPSSLKELLNGWQAIPLEERSRLAQALALESLILSAARQVMHAQQVPAPEERFRHLLARLAEEARHRPEVATTLAKGCQSLVVSLVYTMHPVIHHSHEARELEWELVGQFSRLKGFSTALEKSGLEKSGLEKLPKEMVEAIRRTVRLMVEGAFSLCPLRKTTVTQENQTELEILERLEPLAEEVRQAWNRAVNECDPVLPRDALLLPEISARRWLEFRTWGRGSDADGREKSTAIELGRTLYQNSKSGSYTGPTLDLRQNAEIHTMLLSALIQHTYRESRGLMAADGTLHSRDDFRFQHFCEDFVERHNTPDSWRSPDESIYQELGEHRAAFARSLLLSDWQLVPDSIRWQTAAFVKDFPALEEKVMHEHGLDPRSTSYDDLARYQPNRPDMPNAQRALRQAVRNHVFLVHDSISKVRQRHFHLSDNGLRFTPDHYDESRDLLERTYRLDGEGVKVPLTLEERAICLDAAKRLYVIGDAIRRFGCRVATRHQIANFGGPEHFYEMLVLFRETGLITIENGEITRVEMGIMPLLETLEDMQRAPRIFGQLLDDPLIRSYYRTRGVAELMVGFSDGAKSAGNLSSEWQTYRTMRELTDMFAGHGIPVRWLQGRGRGVDRGGSVELGAAFAMLPDEILRQCESDVTIQADLPMDMAGCPGYGRDQLASMVSGALLSHLAACTRTPEEKAQLLALEIPIDRLAAEANRHFLSRVREHPEASKFLSAMPRNPDISSRSTVRGGTAKRSYEAIRAIPVEDAARLSDLPFHNAGIKEAFERFMESGEEIDGKRGEEGLRALARHPFFRTFLCQLEAGLECFDPAIARACFAEKTGCGQWIEQMITSLTGLREQVKRLLYPVENPGNSAVHFLHEVASGEISHALHLRDTLAHTLLASLPTLQPNRQRDAEAFVALRHGLFTAMIERSHLPRPQALVSLPPEWFRPVPLRPDATTPPLHKEVA